MAGGNLRLLHVNKITEREFKWLELFMILMMNSVRYMKSQQFLQLRRMTKHWTVTLDYLSKKQQTQLKDLLHRHRTLLCGKIKRAKVGEHVIKLKTEEETMKPKTYKIPENLKRKVDVQIDKLLELGLIEPVVSEIAHPVVCVHKKDGTIRLCIDFRSLNALTVPDAYPMQNMMELNFLVGGENIH
ncbi:retrovirus-related Pol polyprotein from transposon 17.6 [Trichonephila clavipes]|nr:retrovirus-related Pol polyprotein from transposon 17.6 [Trichonephila clavipes]